MDINLKTENLLNKIECELFNKAKVTVFIKRDDLVHPIYGGNKFRKLKYNIEAILNNQPKTVLTFGGAFSNHIAATAFAGKKFNFKTIGIIRGDELKNNQYEIIANNKTLREAQKHGMQIIFVSRENYKRKYDTDYWDELKQEFGDILIIPEGGSNELALKGCKEIVTEITTDFDYMITAVGTGTTLIGIAQALKPHQKVIGIEVYKNKLTALEHLEFLKHQKVTVDNDKILLKNYAFKGYGKSDVELNAFCESFNKEYQILIEPIYTGKMFFGLFDLIQKGFFKKNSIIIALHTGGLQYRSQNS
jgi:1-aminocyclopropane-1-carboxylate deaminase